MGDILFRNNENIFSYRVTGILLRDNKILLQKPVNDTGFAIPGGHVVFGETGNQALAREFKEETGAGIIVGNLKWIAEIFFSWGDKPCHQICLYYEISLGSETQIPLDGLFMGKEHIESRDSIIEFHWMPLEMLNQIEVYPTNISDLMKQYSNGIKHFIYREGNEMMA